MAVTYETINPSLVPNTIMEKMLLNGVHKTYKITPAEGYVLHDNRVDAVNIDPITGVETGEITLRYSIGPKTVAASYDFTLIVPDTITDVNGNIISVNKIGAFELFAVPASAVPEANTYGLTNPQVTE